MRNKIYYILLVISILFLVWFIGSYIEVCMFNISNIEHEYSKYNLFMMLCK